MAAMAICIAICWRIITASDKLELLFIHYYCLYHEPSSCLEYAERFHRQWTIIFRLMLLKSVRIEKWSDNLACFIGGLSIRECAPWRMGREARQTLHRVAQIHASTLTREFPSGLIRVLWTPVARDAPNREPLRLLIHIRWVNMRSYDSVVSLWIAFGVSAKLLLVFFYYFVPSLSTIQTRNNATESKRRTDGRTDGRLYTCIVYTHRSCTGCSACIITYYVAGVLYIILFVAQWLTGRWKGPSITEYEHGQNVRCSDKLF